MRLLAHGGREQVRRVGLAVMERLGVDDVEVVRCCEWEYALRAEPRDEFRAGERVCWCRRHRVT